MAEQKKDLKNEVIDFDGETKEPSSVGQEEKPKEEKAPKAKKVEKAEDVDSLPEWAKERLQKAEKDKDSYKKGMLKYESKVKKYSLTKKKKDEEKKEEYPEWDDTSKKFQEQTLSEAEKVADKKALDVVQQYNEKIAVAQFIKENPQVKKRWDKVVSNYNPKSGKETPDDIIKDLQSAYILTRFEDGELSEKDLSGAKKDLANLSTVSKTSSKSSKEGKSLSEGALRLAERMRVDPKQLAKEDDSSYAEIKF